MKKFSLSLVILLLASFNGHCTTIDPNQLAYESYKIAATKEGKDKLPECKELRINALNNNRNEHIDITLHLGANEPNMATVTTPYLFNFIMDQTEQLTLDAFAGFDFSNNNPVALDSYEPKNVNGE